MTDLTVSIADDNIMTVLRSFLLQNVSCEVIQNQTNLDSMPNVSDFIMINQKSMIQLAKPADSFGSTTKTILSKYQFTAQIDFYGDNAMARASSVTALLFDESGTDFFKASGYDMQTLYATDAQQMPLITGELQYLTRWTISAVFQINQTISLPVQTANTLTADLINVGVVFPA